MNRYEINSEDPLGIDDDVVEELVIPFLERHENLIGARMVLFLLDHPDEHINVLDLSDRVCGDGVLSHVDGDLYSRYVETSFEIMDPQYQQETKLERKKLIKQAKGARDLGDHATEEKLIQELNDINSICGPCTKPGGGSRNFPGTAEAEFRRMSMNYNYLLRIAQVEEPVVHECVKRHVRTGYSFCWMGRCPPPKRITPDRG